MGAEIIRTIYKDGTQASGTGQPDKPIHGYIFQRDNGSMDLMKPISGGCTRVTHRKVERIHLKNGYISIKELSTTSNKIDCHRKNCRLSSDYDSDYVLQHKMNIYGAWEDVTHDIVVKDTYK